MAADPLKLPLEELVYLRLGHVNGMTIDDVALYQTKIIEPEYLWLPKIVSGLAQMPRWVILASGCLTS